ncbi:unnamed protein product [Brassica oleracea var. botrytis]
MFHRKRTGNMNPESKTAPITRRKVAHHRHNIPSPEAHKPPETAKPAETTGEKGGSPESKTGDYILRKVEPQSRKPTNHP